MPNLNKVVNNDYKRLLDRLYLGSILSKDSELDRYKVRIYPFYADTLSEHIPYAPIVSPLKGTGKIRTNLKEDDIVVCTFQGQDVLQPLILFKMSRQESIASAPAYTIPTVNGESAPFDAGEASALPDGEVNDTFIEQLGDYYIESVDGGFFRIMSSTAVIYLDSVGTILLAGDADFYLKISGKMQLANEDESLGTLMGDLIAELQDMAVTLGATTTPDGITWPGVTQPSVLSTNLTSLITRFEALLKE